MLKKFLLAVLLLGGLAPAAPAQSGVDATIYSVTTTNTPSITVTLAMCDTDPDYVAYDISIRIWKVNPTQNMYDTNTYYRDLTTSIRNESGGYWTDSATIVPYYPGDWYVTGSVHWYTRNALGGYTWAGTSDLGTYDDHILAQVPAPGGG